MFEVDDHVVATGITISDTGDRKRTFKICQVVAVGADELLVKYYRWSSSPHIFRIPKNACEKISDIPLDAYVGLRRPKVNDVVMEVAISYEKCQTRVGILMEIIYEPGSQTKAKILYNNSMENVIYDNLMLLEK